MSDNQITPFTPSELYKLNDFLSQFLFDRGFTFTESLEEAKQNIPSMTDDELDNLVHHTASEFLSALTTGPAQGAAIYL
jgi:hypothetical protein